MPSFEESLKKLETIVDQLEKGDLALEESLKLFEEGVGLSAACKSGAGRGRGQGADAGETARRVAEAGGLSDGKAVLKTGIREQGSGISPAREPAVPLNLRICLKTREGSFARICS